MEYLAMIGTVTAIHALAVISPGPDFIMVIRNSLVYSRRIGIWTSVGFGLGIAVHITYSLAGLAIIISQSILLFNVIKFFGAGYLIYIGIRSILSKKSNVNLEKEETKKEITPLNAVRIGFLTNVLNPKATLFFLSLFTFVITPNTPGIILAIVSAIMIINTMIWFSIVSIFISQKNIRKIFEKFEGIFNKTFGVLLVTLGLKIALTKR